MAWTLRGLTEAAGVTADVTGDGAVTGVAYDHRRVQRGDLFCCIPGQVVDGHGFAAASVEAGASCLLVERFLDVDAPQARVQRVRSVLGQIASTFYGRPCDRMPVAAVTGTNGKTTVTYLLEAIA